MMRTNSILPLIVSESFIRAHFFWTGDTKDLPAYHQLTSIWGTTVKLPK